MRRETLVSTALATICAVTLITSCGSVAQPTVAAPTQRETLGSQRPTQSAEIVGSVAESSSIPVPQLLLQSLPDNSGAIVVGAMGWNVPDRQDGPKDSVRYQRSDCGCVVYLSIQRDDPSIVATTDSKTWQIDTVLGTAERFVAGDLRASGGPVYEGAVGALRRLAPERRLHEHAD